MSKGGLILPPSMEPSPRAATRRGGDLATLDQVNNIAGNLVGPVAIIVEEMMGKIARCEDKLGITNETVAADEKDNPTGTAPRTMLLLRVILERLDTIERHVGLKASEPSEAGGDVE